MNRRQATERLLLAFPDMEFCRDCGGAIPKFCDGKPYLPSSPSASFLAYTGVCGRAPQAHPPEEAAAVRQRITVAEAGGGAFATLPAGRCWSCHQDISAQLAEAYDAGRDSVEGPPSPATCAEKAASVPAASPEPRSEPCDDHRGQPCKCAEVDKLFGFGLHKPAASPEPEGERAGGYEMFLDPATGVELYRRRPASPPSPAPEAARLVDGCAVCGCQPGTHPVKWHTWGQGDAPEERECLEYRAPAPDAGQAPGKERG